MNNMAGLRIVAVAALLLAGAAAPGAAAGAYVEEELRIPYSAAEPHGLEAMSFVQPRALLAVRFEVAGKFLLVGADGNRL